MNKKRKKFLSRDDIELTLLSLPTLIWFIVFSFIPMIGILIAFKDFRILPGQGFIGSLMTSKNVGLSNFEFLFKTPDAAIIIRNTLLYNILFIIIGTVIPVILAIAITQLYNKKLAKICQTAMFLPHFLSWVVVSYFVFSFLSYDKGIFNQILAKFGGEPIQWYMESKYWPYILVFMNTWKGMGYGMVVYLAAITGIDQSYYEAALIDGAKKWEQIKYITLPLIKPIIIIMFIMAVGNIFKSDFGLFYQVPRNSGLLFTVTSTIDTYVYKAIEGTGSMAMSSAAGFLQSVIGCITIIIANAIVKKIDGENGLF
ncbi:ABC transporter permease subunit [uncultured Tyzzerella sp.]|uniref:ABC transporter permease n=1 Tax=uncultured Tyzzerella sp. TaxID=2321398 RepID=UPI002942535F|nr:ABC transporter permease subunit [uncultured Tyzzerella sp.]